jgi:RNA polymerase sigma-70 factor (ECF subfamily)
MEARVENASAQRLPDAETERLVSFYETQRARGVAYCRRIVGDVHVAEDLYQEGWLRLKRHVARHGELRAELAGLLYRVLANLSFNYLARRERRTVSLHDLESSPDRPEPSPSLNDRRALPPDELTNQRETAQRVARAIQGLGRLPRRAFMLKEFEDRSYREIAAELGVSESNVGVLIFRARERLREVLGE